MVLCEHCHKNEAVVHELTIHHGQPTEKHLCKTCAAELGIDDHSSGSVPGVLTKLLVSEAAAVIGPVSGGPSRPGAATRELVCPGCGLRYGEFRQSGLLGCSECYRRFAERLTPLLERAQDGGCHHVGKVPRRALAASRLRASAGHAEALEALIGDQEARSSRLRALREQLGRALSGEDYERAAMIRDAIGRLTDLLEEDDGGPPGPGARQ